LLNLAFLLQLNNYNIMWIQLLIVFFLLGILASLGTALVRLMRDDTDSKGALKALMLRISLSVVLFVLLMLATATGLITPNGWQP